MQGRTVTAALFLLLAATIAQAGMFSDGAKEKIDAVVHSSTLSCTNVGIKVVALSTGKTLYAENGNKLFIPASNAKLATAYCALKILTPQYVFPTTFSTDAVVSSTTVKTLYVKGCGDPSVRIDDLKLQALALSGKFRHVAGDIVVDDSYFDAVPFGKGWMWDEGIDAYNAPISPWPVNGNCVDILLCPGAKAGDPVSVRTEPPGPYAVVLSSAVTGACTAIAINREETPSGDRYLVSGAMAAGSPERRYQCTVSKPGLYAATVLREQLARLGVKVDGTAREGIVPSGTVCVERTVSRPLAEIVRNFLKDSDNLMGECLLKSLGATQYGVPGEGDRGIAVMANTLTTIGIKEGSYRLVDGSGLSTYNLLSPDILVTLLQAAYNDLSCLPEYMDALAVAGVDGTLKDRCAGPPLARYVRAKTGTMSGVSCISGYLQTRKGTMLAFSIMMNGYTGTSKPVREKQDEILRALWENY